MEDESQIIKGKYAADISSIKKAHDRIKSRILRTPVLSSTGGQLYFKCGCLKKGKYAADISSITKANQRIKPHVLRTPVLTSTSLNAILGRQLHFKCECFQKCGASEELVMRSSLLMTKRLLKGLSHTAAEIMLQPCCSTLYNNMRIVVSRGKTMLI